MAKSISLENRKTVKKALSWLTKNTNSMSTLEAIRLPYDPPAPSSCTLYRCLDKGNIWFRLRGKTPTSGDMKLIILV